MSLKGLLVFQAPPFLISKNIAMGFSRRSFLRVSTVAVPLPFLPGCQGFIENLDTSAGGEGAGIQFGAFFGRYRVVSVRRVPNFRGPRPVVTAIVVQSLKKEQARLKKAANEGGREVPKIRKKAQTARSRAAAYRAKAKITVVEPSPRPEPSSSPYDPARSALNAEVNELEVKADQQIDDAVKLEAQAEDMEAKARQLLEAAQKEIGTILAEDALHTVHIPTSSLMDTVYQFETEVEDTSDLVVQSDQGTLPLVEG
jgi:hypothetical protein